MERYKRDRGYYNDAEYNDREMYGYYSRHRYNQYEGNRPYDRAYHRNMDSEHIPNYHSHPRDRDINYYGSYNRSENDFRESNRYSQNQERNPGYGDIRRGYGISNFEGTSDRYNTLDSDQQGRFWQDEQPYYSNNRDRIRSTGFSGGMGESFPHSHGGVPDYGTGTFRQGTGTGMGSTYGGKNYGGGTGYMSGHRGGSFGNSVYGSSSGNYGGYGSMGGGTYGGGRSSSGRGDTSHNSNRSTTELGG